MPACSYCGNISHNIRNCDSPIINIKYNNIKLQYLNSTILNPINPQRYFINIVSRIYNLSIIKAVSVKFTNSPAYLNKTSHLIKLFEHFSHMGTNSAFRTPDPIPSYAQDLNANYEAPEEIHWFIDRMPSPNLLFNFNSHRIERQIDLNLIYDYIQAEDEFIPISRNLNNEFDSSSKKYCITPILSDHNTNANDLGLEKEDCAICYEQIGCFDSVLLNCKHKFCSSCVLSTLSHQRFKRCNPSCALCRQTITSITTKNNETFNNISKFCIL
jgi:hypothetical protein